jgi:hypothetical protein
MMKTSSIVLNSFLDGFTLAGLFGWAKLPGAPDIFCEEDSDFFDSRFVALFMDHLPFVPVSENEQQGEQELVVDRISARDEQGRVKQSPTEEEATRWADAIVARKMSRGSLARNLQLLCEQHTREAEAKVDQVERIQKQTHGK